MTPIEREIQFKVDSLFRLLNLTTRKTQRDDYGNIVTHETFLYDEITRSGMANEIKLLLGIKS